MKKYLIFLIASLIVIAGGFIVYPKPLFIKYDGLRYYGPPKAEELVAKTEETISVIKHTSEEFLLVINDDSTIIRINFDTETINITKDTLTFSATFEFDDDDIDEELLKYGSLAKAWLRHQSTMNEDYSFIFYTLGAITFLGALLGLLSVKRNKELVNIVLLVIYAATLVATGFFNLILIVAYL